MGTTLFASEDAPSERRKVMMWRCPSCGWGTTVERVSGMCENLDCDNVPMVGPIEEDPDAGAAIHVSRIALLQQEPAVAVPKPRPWRPMWDSVQRLHERVIAGMAPSQDPTTDGVLTVDLLALLMVNAWHLRDYIEADSSLPQGAQDEALNLRMTRKGASARAIHVAADFVDTYKHAARRQSYRTVSMNEVASEWSPHGTWTRVTFLGQVGDQRESIDALWLANAVVADWLAFFQRHGIDAG